MRVFFKYVWMRLVFRTQTLIRASLVVDRSCLVHNKTTVALTSAMDVGAADQSDHCDCIALLLPRVVIIIHKSFMKPSLDLHALKYSVIRKYVTNLRLPWQFRFAMCGYSDLDVLSNIYLSAELKPFVENTAGCDKVF